MKPSDLKTISPKQETHVMQNEILSKANLDRQLEILEAGCGRRWPLNLGDTNYRLMGVDLDETALSIRKSVVKDLDETILGDLRHVDLDENTYDIIYNSCVLEHIDNAKVVLQNFAKWLKPEGLLILRFPDRNSVYGFFTRINPPMVPRVLQEVYSAKTKCRGTGLWTLSNVL